MALGMCATSRRSLRMENSAFEMGRREVYIMFLMCAFNQASQESSVLCNVAHCNSVSHHLGEDRKGGNGLRFVRTLAMAVHQLTKHAEVKALEIGNVEFRPHLS